MIIEKDTYWVRTSYSGRGTLIHGQNNGDIVKTLKKDDGVAYTQSHTATDGFRQASSEEISAYNNGVRNIKNIKPDFKKGDTLEFISKNPISTCFNVGQHVTFVLYGTDGYMTAEDARGTQQSAYAYQFKAIDIPVKYSEHIWVEGDMFILNPDSEYYKDQGFNEDGSLKVRTITNIDDRGDHSIDSDDNCYRPEDIQLYLAKEKETPIPISIFKPGDVVRCLVNDPSNLRSMCKKGDLLRVSSTNSYTSRFSCSEHNGYSNGWGGLHTNEFELTTLTTTYIGPPRYIPKVGDIIIGNKNANSYGVTKEGWKGEVVSISYNGLTFGAKDVTKGHSTFTLDVGKFDLFNSTGYKYKVGQTVKVIHAGAGIGDEHIGKLVTITGLGKYASWNGYKCEPPYGNCKFGGYIGEQSFNHVEAEPVIEIPDPHIHQRMKEEPFDWTIRVDPVEKYDQWPAVVATPSLFYPSRWELGYDPYEFPKKESKTTEPPFFKVERI